MSPLSATIASASRAWRSPAAACAATEAVPVSFVAFTINGLTLLLAKLPWKVIV